MVVLSPDSETHNPDTRLSIPETYGHGTRNLRTSDPKEEPVLHRSTQLQDDITPGGIVLEVGRKSNELSEIQLPDTIGKNRETEPPEIIGEDEEPGNRFDELNENRPRTTDITAGSGLTNRNYDAMKDLLQQLVVPIGLKFVKSDLPLEHVIMLWCCVGSICIYPTIIAIKETMESKVVSDWIDCACKIVKIFSLVALMFSNPRTSLIVFVSATVLLVAVFITAVMMKTNPADKKSK